MRSPLYSHNVHPVWYNFTAGNWSSSGCHILRLMNSEVRFSCKVLGHYGLMQDTSSYHLQGNQKGAAFRLNAPAVYIGSFVCIIFLTFSNDDVYRKDRFDIDLCFISSLSNLILVFSKKKKNLK